MDSGAPPCTTSAKARLFLPSASVFTARVPAPCRGPRGGGVLTEPGAPTASALPSADPRLPRSPCSPPI
eukprot:9476285-Pyramimonas_sp.AAC.1